MRRIATTNNNEDLANTRPLSAVTPSDSVIATLRSVVPRRRLNHYEALQIAELQANRLLEYFKIGDLCVPNEIITELPHISVQYEHELPISGSSHWEAGRWIITLNADEPYVRRRFSLMHEFKHVLDHNHKQSLYGDTDNDKQAAERSERVADHFAACLLMPKRSLKSQWFAGGQQLEPLAYKLQVSTRALSIRLWHLGIERQTPRCARQLPAAQFEQIAKDARFGGTRYFRQKSVAGVMT